MDAKIVKDIVSLLEQVHPTNLPTQPGVYTRKQRQCYSTRPPSPGRPEGSTKEALPASLPNPSFFPALQTNSYFYPRCEQDCLRKMLLITSKVVSLRVEQNNNSNS